MKFTGKTTREAISKAVNHGRKSTRRSPSDCDDIESRLRKMEIQIEEMRKRYSGLRSQISNLRRDQRQVSARIGLEVSLMIFAIGRLAKAGRIAARIRQLLRRQDQLGQIGLVLVLIGEVFGAMDVIELAQESADIDNQLRQIVRENNSLGASMYKLGLVVEDLQRRYKESDCFRALSDREAMS